MPRPKRYTATPSALDRDGICTASSPSGADTLVINGALATVAYDRNGIFTAATPTAGTLDIAGNLGASGTTFAADTRIAIYAAADETGSKFTIWGHKDNGDVVTETIVGPNAGSVYSVNVYRSIAKITVDVTTSGDVEVGPLGCVVLGTPQYIATYAATASDNATITGTDRNDNVITETIAVTTTTTTVGVKNFKTVDKVTVDGAITSVEIGVDSTFSSQWFGLDMYAHDFNVYVFIDDATTGTFNVVTTTDDINASDFDESTATGIDALTNSGDIAAITADGHGVLTTPCRALRLQSTSADHTGEVGMDIIQGV
jgi:hypothetical protein